MQPYDTVGRQSQSLVVAHNEFSRRSSGGGGVSIFDHISVCLAAVCAEPFALWHALEARLCAVQMCFSTTTRSVTEQYLIGIVTATAHGTTSVGVIDTTLLEHIVAIVHQPIVIVDFILATRNKWKATRRI